MTTAIDFDARYTVDGCRGVAWWIAPLMIADTFDDGEETGETYPSDTQVIAVMVGDDRRHTVDIDDLTAIAEDDYCHVCGQIGCGHDGRDK